MKKLLGVLFFSMLAFSFTCCDKPEDNNEGSRPGGITDEYGYTVTPTANFTYSRDESFTVEFTNTSSDATSYLWDFGDGATSTQANPSHTYASRGTKYVVLTAKNGTKSSTAYANINMTSYIKMQSTSNYNYKIYVDGIDMGVIAGGGSQQYEVNPGSHSVRVLQQNGYTLYPTEETYTVGCTAGYITTREFPVDPLGKSGQN